MCGNKAVFGKRVHSSEFRILLAFLLNLLFAFVEVWGSMLTGSVTIFSDAIHDFGDCVALGIAWHMEKLSGRQPNARYTYGYRRFSVVAGLVNNLILLTGGILLIVTSVQRFFCPRTIDGSGMLLFAIFGIVLNGTAMLLTAKGKNINEKTISMHMLEDVLTWVVVLIVGGIMCFWELPVLDSLLSIAMTVVIFAGVAKNMRRIFGVLTMASPLSEEQYEQLTKRLNELVSYGSVAKLRLFSMDGEESRGEVEYVLREELSPEEFMLLYQRIKEQMEAFGVQQSMVQIQYEFDWKM